MSRARPPKPSLALPFALVAVVALAIRLPQLLGPHLLPDGDEAILWLMARRTLEEGRPPLSFTGQVYGFTLLETLLVSGAFAVFGESTLAMKLAVFPIWIAGAWCLVAVVARRGGARAAWIAALLIATVPAWGAWAMKARGGYLSAFATCWGTLALLARRPLPEPRSRGALAAVGALWALTFLGQLVWWIALTPFVGAFFLARRRRSDVLPAVLGAAAVAACLVAAGLAFGSRFWTPSLVNEPFGVGVAAVPEQVRVLFGGAFYLRLWSDDGVFVLAGKLWCVALGLAAAAGLVRAFTARRAAAELFAVLSIAALLAFSIPAVTPRYLLPVADLSVALVALELARRRRAGLALGAALVLAAAGAVAVVEQRRLAYSSEIVARVPSERRALDQLLRTLDGAGVRHVYALDNLQPWILMAKSGGDVTARWKTKSDRDPELTRAVDRARSRGLPTAVVGLLGDRAFLEQRTRMPFVEVGGRYLVGFDPSPADLWAIGFELNE